MPRIEVRGGIPTKVVLAILGNHMVFSWAGAKPRRNTTRFKCSVLYHSYWNYLETHTLSLIQLMVSTRFNSSGHFHQNFLCMHLLRYILTLHGRGCGLHKVFDRSRNPLSAFRCGLNISPRFYPERFSIGRKVCGPVIPEQWQMYSFKDKRNPQ